MAQSTFRQLLPHFVILVMLITAVLVTVRVFAPDLNIWFQTAIAILVGTAYPPLLRYFGVAPEPWQ
jgi:hypothetical protein